MNKAIVLGSNYYIGLSIIRCLGKEGVDVYAMDYSKHAYGAKSKYLKDQLIVPHYKDDKALLSYLVDYGQKQAAKPVLFPSADAYVAFMDKHMKTLKDYYLFPMSDQGLWSKLMCKDDLRDLCDLHGVKVPYTMMAGSYNLNMFEDNIGFPCLLKPTESPSFVAFYRQKMFVCHNHEELQEAMIKTAVDGFDMMIQQIISGPDSHVATYDVYLDQSSRVTHAVTCNKLRQFPINYGASSYTIQKEIPELHEIGQAFLEAVAYKGFAEIEFKKNEKDGQYYLIEVNTRTTTLNEMLYKVGINFPMVAYKDLLGQEIGCHIIHESKGIAFRYHIEDLISVYKYIKTKQLNIWSYFKSLRRKKVYAIWQIGDPKPYFNYFLKKILRK